MYFAKADLASPGQRIGAVGIDAVVTFLLALTIVVFVPDSTLATFLALAVACAYLGALKATPWSTLGYQMFGLRLVDFEGATPAVWRATYRFLWLILLPNTAIADLVFLSSDAHRQTFRDKLAATAFELPLPTGFVAVELPRHVVGISMSAVAVSCLPVAARVRWKEH